VLEEGVKFHTVGNPMKDMEFVAAQQMSRTDIAVMFKLPPNYLGGSSGDSLTYATVESNQIQFACMRLLRGRTRSRRRSPLTRDFPAERV
jgi:phage portal protein BeeE